MDGVMKLLWRISRPLRGVYLQRRLYDDGKSENRGGLIEHGLAWADITTRMPWGVRGAEGQDNVIVSLHILDVYYMSKLPIFPDE
jgi:hypothetical protein